MPAPLVVLKRKKSVREALSCAVVLFHVPLVFRALLLGKALSSGHCDLRQGRKIDMDLLGLLVYFPKMSAQLFLALLLAALPQGKNGVRGQVLVPTTRSLGRIEVILEKSSAFLARTYTDNDGNYEFNGLPDGEYAVVVRLEGYEEARETVNFGREGGTTINIALTPKGGAAPDKAEVVNVKYPRKVMDDYEKGLEESRKGNTSKAIERLEGVIKAEASFQQAHNALGAQYQKVQRYPDAEKEYKAAIQLDARYSDPLINLGSLYIETAGQAREKKDNQAFGAALDSAVRALNQAIQLQPASSKAYYFLGTTYYTGGIYPKAEENLTHALELEKGMGQAELMMANVYIKQQKWPQALQFLDSYLKDNPKAPDREQVQQTRVKVAAQK